MSFSIKGYVLEPPRVGTANSSFTMPPNNVIANPVMYAGYFPDGSEPNPRVDYMAIVMRDGLLVDALFGWTKNEIVARFDYDGSVQRFKPLPGGPLLAVGVVGPTLNTSRLKVPAPTLIGPAPSAPAPWRLSVGVGSGTTLDALLVSSFSSPSAGTVEILSTTGELNWNPGDLTTYAGQDIRFQRQAFFGFTESNGKLGLSNDVLLLTPLPASTQYPLVRLGYGAWLIPDEYPDESTFGVDPPAGHFKWAVDTGRIKLTAADETLAKGVYYDGVLMQGRIALPRVSLGTVASPSSFSSQIVGGDLIFSVPGYQFPYFQYVTSFGSVGQAGVVQLHDAGAVTTPLFSLADQGVYGAQSVTLVFGDLPLERGISLRLFRTPVNLTGTPVSSGGSKDVTAVYAAPGSTFSNPIIGAPDVFLPQIPRDDGTLDVSVAQGTGTFTPGPFPLLDGSVPLPVSPGPTYGYVLDYDAKKLKYALRKNDQLIQLVQPTGALVLPDPLVQPGNLTFALETWPGSGVYTPLVLGTDALFDGNSTVTFTSTVGGLITSGTGTFTGTTLAAPLGDFSGVLPGDTLIVASGVFTVVAVTDSTHLETDLVNPAPASVSYEVHRGEEILADRYFAPIELVDPNTSFTRSMTPGPLKINRDYKITPALGFISFTKRFLALESATLNYSTIDSTTGLPVPVVGEPAVFLVRKELCQPRTAPTSILHFNPLGRPVASTPAPQVWRGGRPQDSTQISVDTVNSTITFLPDRIVTDALPHGAVVNPDENVYVDYYITQAIGGEQTITIQQPPMSIAQVALSQDNTSFIATGDQTANFPSGYLLRVENIEVHLIASSTYDSGTDQTTVALVPGDQFQDDYNNPKLYLSSGPTRVTSAPFLPSYFVFETSPFHITPRGMNQVVVFGDRTASYKAGTVIRFWDLTNAQYYLVSAVSLNATGDTVLTLTSNTRQQYALGSFILSHTVRPILEDGAKTATTSKVPVLTEPYTVLRRVAGAIGRTLTLKTDYTIDEAGVVTYAAPLTPDEEIAIFYTGHVIQPAGLRLKTSYTALTVPSSANGLPNQILLADYMLDAPDTFYFRVETMTDFQAEIAAQYEASAKASVPSGGPIVSNSGGGALYTKGRPSVYFDEGHLSNEDIIARRSLLWYNTTINLLEDALEDLDGRVVGNHSGRLLYDGTLGAVHPPGVVTNQIDDLFKVSPAPYTITFPPFAVTSIGTYQSMYLPAPTSRFYPTFAESYGVTAAGSETGDPIYDTGHKSLTNVSSVRTRAAWAVVTQDATGSPLRVDNSSGSQTLARPAFKNGMKCVIQRPDGTFVNNEATPVTVTVVDQTHLAVAGLAGPVPAGSSIYRSPSDDSAQTGIDVLTNYQSGRDYDYDANQGQITFVKASWPLDGSLSPFPIPTQLCAVEFPAGQPLVAYVGFNNAETAPVKFPALYGGTTDDNGDMSFPILSPSFNCEYTVVGDSPSTTPIGRLTNAVGILTAIQAATTAPTIETGNLVALNTLQLPIGVFPSPVPQLYDLVRITSGANAGTPYRRILVATANTLQVDVPWGTLEAGVTFEVAVSSTTIAGNGVFTTSVLTDLLANFTPVQVGWTVVVTGGAHAGFRLQVVSVDSPTQITFSAGLPSGGVFAYRVDNPLPTFGGPGSMLETLAQENTALLALYTTQTTPTAEQTALSGFFEQLFTDVATSTAGATSGTTLTDATVDFFALGVLVGQVVYIRSGSNRGVYQIQSVAQHDVTVDVAFPVPVGAVSYRVDKFFGASVPGMRSVFTVLASVDDFITTTQTFDALVTTPFSVVKPGPVPDTVAFARAWLGPELAARSAAISSRQALIGTAGTGYTAMLSNVLGGSDHFYDKRYTWIDARIDMQTGIIVKRSRAVAARVQSQANVVNQLFKLLSVQGT